MDRSTADTKKRSPVQSLRRVVTSVTHDNPSRSPSLFISAGLQGRYYFYFRSEYTYCALVVPLSEKLKFHSVSL